MFPGIVCKVYCVLSASISLIVLNSCATQKLIDTAIHGDDTSNMSAKVKLLRAFRADGFAHLCLEKESNSLGIKKRSHYTVTIPLPGNPKLRLSYRSSQHAPLLLVKNNTVKQQACGTGGQPIHIVALENQAKLELPQHVENAIYAYYNNGYLHGLGYVAKTPILTENHLFASYYQQNPYNFSIELGKTVIYQHDGLAQPYLLVFTPFTLTADAVGTAFGVAGLWVYSQGGTNTQATP